MKMLTLLLPILLMGLATLFPLTDTGSGSVGWFSPDSIISFDEWFSILLFAAVWGFPLGTLLLIALVAGLFLFLFPKVRSKSTLVVTVVIMLCGLGSLYLLMESKLLTGGILMLLGYALMLIRPVTLYLGRSSLKPTAPPSPSSPNA